MAEEQALDDYARDLVARKAAGLARLLGLHRHEREDIAQELYLRALRRLKTLKATDPVDHVRVRNAVWRSAANLLRDRRAACRDSRRVAALDIPVRGASGSELDRSALLDQHAHDLRLGRASTDDQKRAELAIDLDQLLQDLPDDQRDLAERLKTVDLSAVSRAYGVPRTTLYAVVARLRRRLAEAGFEPGP